LRIVARYSFNDGLERLQSDYAELLKEVCDAIASVDAEACKTKVSQELTMPGRVLYSPIALNKALLQGQLYSRGWKSARIQMATEIPETRGRHSGFIEADAIKGDVGVEVQFGKYAFLGWDILGKMVIFAHQGLIRVGVEIVPMPELQAQMSTGVGSFAQIKEILEYRGVSNIDTPVGVLGVAP
jgi:hypothetical protein